MQLRLRGPGEVEKHLSCEKDKAVCLSDTQGDICSTHAQCLDVDAKFAYTGEDSILIIYVQKLIRIVRSQFPPDRDGRLSSISPRSGILTSIVHGCIGLLAQGTATRLGTMGA